MTIQMQQLIADRDAIKNEFKKLRDNGELKAGTEEFGKFLNKLEVANKAIQDQEKLEELEKNNFNVKDASKKPDGFRAMIDVMKGRKLSDEAQELIQGGDHGENYLIPEDVRLKINEMKKQYKSAKMLCNVMSTDGITGGFNFDDSSDDGLVDFDDGDVLDDSVAPSFVRKTFTIGYKGAFIPVSDLLKGNEKANLMQYLDGWFVRRAIKKENTDIFAKFKSSYNSGTPKSLADWKALASSINVDLDPAITGSSEFRIVTNQTGFDMLDKATDDIGRPILQPDPNDATIKRFKGHAITQFSDAQLPNIDSTHAPVIYGDTARALWFIENPSYQFASDGGKGIGFTKAQTLLRVIEGYDVMAAHTDDYIYGSIAVE